jgi:hypothetical protein
MDELHRNAVLVREPVCGAEPLQGIEHHPAYEWLREPFTLFGGETE